MRMLNALPGLFGLVLSLLALTPAASQQLGVPITAASPYGDGSHLTNVSGLTEVTLTSKGADPTGATDSCSAWTAAVQALPAANAKLHIPGGTYSVACGVSVTDKCVTIEGDGAGVTIVNFTSTTAGTAGIKATYTQPGCLLTIKDISLVTMTAQSTGNAAIAVTRPSSQPSVNAPSVTIENVYMAGGGRGYWADGITCTYCSFGHFRNYMVVGGNYSSSSAIPSRSTSRSLFLDNSTDAEVIGAHAYFVDKCVSLDHDSEGFKYDLGSCVDSNWGVYTEATWHAPSIVIANSHWNVAKGGLYLLGGPAAGQNGQGQIHDNLIYRWINATANPWYAIQCQNGTKYGCKDWSFHDNNTISFKGGGPTGVAYCFGLGSLATDIAIHDNTCRDTDYFADMGSSTSATISVTNNHGIGTGNTAWENPATTNVSAVWQGNLPIKFGSSDEFYGSVGLNATQWNVGGQAPTLIATNASAPITVTAAFGGWPGLILTVQCQDTNTTLQNGGGSGAFSLAGGVNYTCPRVGATITFRYSDQWREIGRAG